MKRRLIEVTRLRNSNNGNPRFRLLFEDGSTYRTKTDANINHTISRETHEGRWVELQTDTNRDVIALTVVRKPE